MSEQVHTDVLDDSIIDQQRQELMCLIWSYTLALEKYVVNLRHQINTLTAQQGLQSRYPDPESDFRVRYFRDLPACQEFSSLLENDKTDLVLPD